MLSVAATYNLPWNRDTVLLLLLWPIVSSLLSVISLYYITMTRYYPFFKFRRIKQVKRKFQEWSFSNKMECTSSVLPTSFMKFPWPPHVGPTCDLRVLQQEQESISQRGARCLCPSSKQIHYGGYQIFKGKVQLCIVLLLGIIWCNYLTVCQHM